MESTTMVSKSLTGKHEPLVHIQRPLALPLLVCFILSILGYMLLLICFLSLIPLRLIIHIGLCIFFHHLYLEHLQITNWAYRVNLISAVSVPFLQFHCFWLIMHTFMLSSKNRCLRFFFFEWIRHYLVENSLST